MGNIINKEYTFTEINKHNKLDDMWIIIDNKVYDVSNYLLKHPGGHRPLILLAGQDATDFFIKVRKHISPKCKIALEKCYIGYVSDKKVCTCNIT